MRNARLQSLVDFDLVHMVTLTHWIMATSIHYAADGINETGTNHSSVHKLTKLCQIIPAPFVVGLHTLHPVKLACENEKKRVEKAVLASKG